MQARVDYDLIAPDYDTRYTLNALPGVAAALHRQASPARAILEVGCGTGRWLQEMPRAALVVGPGRPPDDLRHGPACGPGSQVPIRLLSRDPSAGPAAFSLLRSTLQLDGRGRSYGGNLADR